MNPSLPADYLKRMEKDDPDAYRSEVLGLFRAGLSTLLDIEALDQCVGEHIELAPAGHEYRAFVDVSGGRNDDYTLAIGHKQEKMIVVDTIRHWSPPFDPATVTREAAQVLKSYGITNVLSDRFSAEWSKGQFLQHDITMSQDSPPKSDLYLGMLPIINSRGVLLPQNAKLLKQLRLLERKQGRNKDVVDHPRGQHDDLANALAGLVYLFQGSKGEEGCFIIGGTTY